jgi:RNA polymerase sigma factor (sigma-70 family)
MAVHTAEGDADLPGRQRRRDPRALAQLYDRYGRAVYSLTLHDLRDARLAEDLVQETFLRAWNRIQTLDAGQQELGPWLLTVARDVTADYLRSAGGSERDASVVKEPDAAPPAKLRRRILAAAGYEQRHFGWPLFWAAVAVWALFAAFYFNNRERGFADAALRLRDQMRTQTMDLTHRNEALAIVNGSGTMMKSFGEGKSQEPQGKVFVNPGQGVLLMVSNLPPAPAGKAYQMWVIPKDGNPISGGMFRPEGDGSAMHIERGPMDMHAAGTIAVTVENETGVPRPTSLPLIAAPIQ